jgi:hypothetical protein
MKTMLISVTVGTCLAMFAAGQEQRVDRRAAVPYGNSHEREGFGLNRQSLLAYVITGGRQFGAVDLKSGKFLPIGPGTPPDVGGGLVHGRGTSLLTLAFSGNLDAIDPRTGMTRVVGATGLGD